MIPPLLNWRPRKVTVLVKTKNAYKVIRMEHERSLHTITWFSMVPITVGRGCSDEAGSASAPCPHAQFSILSPFP